MTDTPDPSRPLKNVSDTGKTRQKQPKEPSLGVQSQHIEAVFNHLLPTQAAFQRSAGRCPVCGEPNSCGLSNPATATRPCWCFSVEIAAEAGEQIPDDALNKACICPRCACGELPAKP